VRARLFQRHVSEESAAVARCLWYLRSEKRARRRRDAKRPDKRCRHDLGEHRQVLRTRGAAA